MFRFTTEIKGLAIDLDSFPNPIDEWGEIINHFDCLFITYDTEKKDYLEIVYDAEVLLIDKFMKSFLPNVQLQRAVLKILDKKETELAYVSCNKEFINKALAFYSCVIFVTNKPIEYENICDLPDLICGSLDGLEDFLKNKVVNFIGEEIFPQDNVLPSQVAIPTFSLNCDGDKVVLLCLGRYYGSKTYMNQVHPFSRIVYMNKNQNSKSYRIYDMDFAKILSIVISGLLKEKSDCICNVPVKHNCDNRFDKIIDKIARDNALENISDKFITVKDYPAQKGLSALERSKNVEGAFSFEGTLNGKRVILIDDIITTGTTLRECVKELKYKGAEAIYIVVLGINQRGIAYFNAEQPTVECNNCNFKMDLLGNSGTKELFYRCRNCHSTKNFNVAKNELMEQINSEFEDETEDFNRMFDNITLK